MYACIRFGQALAIAQSQGDVVLEMRTLAVSSSTDFVYLRYQECLEKSLRIIELAHRVDEPGAEVGVVRDARGAVRP